MNFFIHQDLARRQTRRMLILFALAVAAIVVAVDCVVALAFGLGGRAESGAGGSSAGSLAAVSVIVLLVIALASLYRTATLRCGGSVVARELGGMPVTGDTGNFTYQRLRNVVEEIAIAAGVPVPEIFVLEDEAGINAFASGYAPADAAVTVTRGALDKLTRDELQGVIGHEFSHLLNGDMRLNIRLVGIVFGILVVAVVGRRIVWAGTRGRSRDSAGPLVFGAALLVIGYIGVFFARMIKASISRQREYLADASAVQFTRQTDGIAGALKKIGALAEGSKLASSNTEEVAHMLFSDGVGYAALFATHPPLESRIVRLDPSFRADELAAIAKAWSRPSRVGESAAANSGVSIAGFAPVNSVPRAKAMAATVLPAVDAQVRIAPKAVVRQVGNPGTDDRTAAQAIHAGIPDRLRQAAWQPEQAMPLVFSLLLNVDAAVRTKQLDIVAAHYDAGMRATVEALAGALVDLHPMQRVPLAALAFPALRRQPRPRLTTFMIVMRGLIDADSRVTLEEYCLATLIRLQVMDALNPAASHQAGRVKLRDVADGIEDVLSIMARHGNDDPAAAERAYAAGLQEALPEAVIAFRPPVDWSNALDRALPRLDLLAPAGKELVVRALTRSISTDGIVSVSESELLRTVCAALHCPLPPMLADMA